MSQQSKTSFNQVSVFALGNAVLLGGVGARNSVRDACTKKITMQLMVFAILVRLDNFKLSIQKALNMCLKSIKHLFNIRLMFQ